MSEWVQFLRSINPEYDAISRALEMYPTIKPLLAKNFNRIWTITLSEVWPDDFPEAPYSGSESLDNRIEWVATELTKWAGVRRMSWDQWYFDDKRHAEKFITLYYMKWAE